MASSSATVEDDESWLYGDGQQPDNINSFKDVATIKIEPPDHELQAEASEEIASAVAATTLMPVSDEDLRIVRIQSGTATPALSLDIDKANGSKVGDDKEAGELSGEEDLSANHDSIVQERGDEDEDGEDSDSDDDDVQVTIGDIKATSPYGYGVAPVNLNIKRGGAYPGGATQAPGMSKAKGIDLEGMGNINGVPAYEFNLDAMEDKPWRKPGADITDYFNYGFNEDTWKLYCEKQRKLRVETTPILSKVVAVLHSTPKEVVPVSPTASAINENSKYATSSALKKAGPPPGRKLAGSIDVIGGTTTTSRRVMTIPSQMEGSAIQVMTARKPPFPEGLPPPPTGFVPPNINLPPPGMPPPPGLPPPGMPPGLPPGLAVPASFSDHYGPALPYGRPPGGFQPPPSASAPPTMDRGGASAYDSSYYGPSIPSASSIYNPYESSNESQWEPRDRPGSSFSTVPGLPPNWEYGHDHSVDRSPSRSEIVDDDHERRHASRDHRERPDRERDKDRDRDRERDRDRGDRGDRDRERERSRDRDRDRDYDERRDRDRDRERRHRDHRERDKEHRSSKRKHRDEEDSEHRSARHKRKRSRRDKEELEGDQRDQEAETAADGDAASAIVEDERRE